jgi:putative glycosyltransferase (TIGR04372 family)
MMRARVFLRLVKRQIFQILNGGFDSILLKLIARSSSNNFLGSLNILRIVNIVAKRLLELKKYSKGSEVAQLDRLLPKLLITLRPVSNQEIATAITEGKELRRNELFSKEREIYSELSKKVPASIEALSLLASSKYLDGDIRGWMDDYKKILKISGEESDRRFGDDHELRVMGVSWTGPMGHLAQIDAIVKLSRLGQLSPEKRILVTNTSQIANSALLNLWRGHIDVFQLSDREYSRFAKIYYPIFEHVPCIKCVDGNLNQTTAWSNANFLWEKQGNSPLLQVSGDIEARGRKVLRRWGLDENAWFVGLHVRDGQHSRRRRLPNADLATYLPAIRRIIELGGAVIRMGNPGMPALPKMQGLVDYAHSVERVDWMDVFLWGKSKFFIGTNSGGSDVPQVFGVPVIKSNFSHIGQSFYAPNSFMVPKLFRNKRSGQLLTLSEIFESPFAWTVSMSHDGFEIEVIDNDPDDLVDAVNEMHLSLKTQKSAFAGEDKSEYSQRSESIRKKYGALGDLPIGNRFLAKYRDLIQ